MTVGTSLTSEQKLLEALEWMIREDNTYDEMGNEYWINGLEMCRKVVADAKGEEYEPREWTHWKPAN
jgi:hypothetical protein